MATLEEINLGAETICSYIQRGLPFFIGRNGSTEMQVIHFWTTYRKQGIPYPPGMLETLERVSGVWEATPESCDAWAKEYSEALGLLDGLSAGWYTPYAQQELKFLNEYAPNSFFQNVMTAFLFTYFRTSVRNDESIKSFGISRSVLPG